jgi:transposase-like protein
MTYRKDCTLPDELLEQVAEHGLEGLPELLRIVINAAMAGEREKHLGAKAYERSGERRGHANGYKPKTVLTRVGKIAFDVPQVREGGFYPQALTKGLRSERALTLTLAEMYVQGVSTRKVAAITERLCGHAINSMQVSRATAEMDDVVAAWRTRSLKQMVYLYLDARYEKVRQDGHVADAAVLVAAGVDKEGRRQLLGVSVALSEQEAHWRAFLQSLVERGLSGVQLIISDAHFGLKAARQAVFGGVPWQRCQFHLQQNAGQYVPRQELKSEVAADIRAIFNAPSRHEAEALLRKTVEKYSKSAPKLANWLEANLPEGLTVLAFPEPHRRLIRTTNSLERVNRELKRRTRVVGIFPNPAACLRMVTAIASEISDEWFTNRTYLTMENSASK